MDHAIVGNDACAIEVSAMTPYKIVKHMTAPIIVNSSIKTTALVDSGAMGNFIHPRYVAEKEFETNQRIPLVVNDVNGRLLAKVEQQVKLDLKMGSHFETILLDVAPLGGHNMVLGLLWLQQHNPQVDWSRGRMNSPQTIVQTIAWNYPQTYSLSKETSTRMQNLTK
jgi:hypothetical protein